MKSPAFHLLLTFSLLVSPVFADGPEDNKPENVRQIPPPGIEVPAEKKAALKKGLNELKSSLDAIRKDEKASQIAKTYLPDAEACYKAVHDALKHNEFFKPNEIDFAIELLKLGKERAAQLKQGKAPWLTQTGNVFRGYRSKIDGSIQPFGLEIPSNYTFSGKDEWRLDFWFHGRGEKLSEVSFLQQRHNGSGGKISPKDTIVLHPYARYSNANKFAGEEDLFEALAVAKQDYRIDENRILVRGFSMGGAACWQFAVHYAGQWAAASPGAGFSETPDFLKTFQGEDLKPSWWEKKLWRWYDATDWAVNLSNTPTIAYSGEEDKQKQAADMMVAATQEEGLNLVHLIGPGMGHKYHPDTLAEIESRLDSIATVGRDPYPEKVRFQTYTLRYNRMKWVQVDGLAEHWEPGRIRATLSPKEGVDLFVKGITAFSLHFPAGTCPIDPVNVIPNLTINGDHYRAPKPWSDRSWTVWCQQKEGKWELSDKPFPTKKGALTKQHNLQGPIDDAFTDSFMFVSPSGKPQVDLIGEWTNAERNRAIDHWRKQFRGDARVKKDSDVNDADIASNNLVLWGDPASNNLIAKVIKDLPIDWKPDGLTVAGKKYDPKFHTVALIYPNPLNPERYVVLNSGFTYREYDYLNNARQTSKLPDWAVIDLRKKPDTRYPGKVVAAGFFDENWKFKKQPED
ncbi:MAG: hypothetical protein CMO55_25490 [Verrucomicrobiales bacterium]|nr:hypothetical protein [Verrucomicrobiales bacterium]